MLDGVLWAAAVYTAINTGGILADGIILHTYTTVHLDSIVLLVGTVVPGILKHDSVARANHSYEIHKVSQTKHDIALRSITGYGLTFLVLAGNLLLSS